MSAQLPEGFILDIARAAGRQVHQIGTSSEAAIQCPRADRHRNGDAHPSCRLHPKKNTWYCDPCARGGGALELARELGIEISALCPEQPAMRKSAKGLSHSARVRRLEVTGPISASTQTHFGDVLGKRYSESAWRAAGVVEGLVDGEPAIGFPQPSGGFKVCRYRLPDTKRGKAYSWIFTDEAKADLLVVGNGAEVLLVAGEWDMLAALSAGFPCVATGTGGEGTWKPEWSEKLAGKHVHIIYDVDAAGVEGGKKVVQALSGIAASVSVVNLPLSGNLETDGKDLSDFLAINSAEALRDLVNNSGTVAAGLAGSNSDDTPVSDLIDSILSQEGPIRLKRREAARIVIKDLRARGELVQSNGGRLFWCDRTDKRLFDLDGFPFRGLFLKKYQINPAEREFVHIFEAVKGVTREEGRHVQVVRFAFYDLNSRRLYIRRDRGSILRLDGERMMIVDNGTDDVLFEETDDRSAIPLESLGAAGPGDPISELILARVNFMRGAGVLLSPEQQSLMLRAWILACFFPELLPARCLLLLYGEKGSGKSTTLRVVLKLLLGPHANVTPLGKEDGFNAAVSTEYLLVLDNVDSYCKWIEDRLATVATGQTIKLRKLYTTNEMISFPTRCAIALTARTPRFRRDDVVDRLQILRVARLAKFQKESEWYQEIEANRARLWTQILRDLNTVVAALRAKASDGPETIRMADWAALAQTIGTALGESDLIRSALEASELDKAHFLLEADEVYDLLHALAHEKPGREWRAGELFAELKLRAEKADVEFTIKSPRSLGRILHRLEPALKLMISFGITTDDHDKQAVYTVGPLAEPKQLDGSHV